MVENNRERDQDEGQEDYTDRHLFNAFDADLDKEERQDTNLQDEGAKMAQEYGLDTDLENNPTDFSVVDLGRQGDDQPMDIQAIEDLYINRTDREDIADIFDDYTDDGEILDDFVDRQGLVAGGRDELLERLHEHHSKSPDLSAGDVDAAWEDADVSGEESVGSTVPTPDQDVVDEIGDALGIHYDDDEELATFDKLQARDDNRWELDPASANDEDDDVDLDEPVDEW